MGSPSCTLSRDLTGDHQWLIEVAGGWNHQRLLHSCLLPLRWDDSKYGLSSDSRPETRLGFSLCLWLLKAWPLWEEESWEWLLKWSRLKLGHLSDLPSESIHCHCLWILPVFSWITKNHSKRRKLDFSLCGEIPSLPCRRAWGMEDIVAIGFMKNSLS